MSIALSGQNTTILNLVELFYVRNHAALVTHSCCNQLQVCVNQRGVSLGGPGTTA